MSCSTLRSIKFYQGASLLPNTISQRAFNSVLSGGLNYLTMDFRDSFQFVLKKIGIEEKIIVTDLMCVFSYNFMTLLYPFYPFVVLKFVDRVPTEIIRADHLNFPKHGTKFLLSYFVLILAAFSQSIATLYGYFLKIHPNSSFWIVSAVGQSFIMILYFVSLLPIFFMLVWIEKFSQICRETGGGGPLIENAKKCVHNYNCLQEAFGFGFFLIFAYCQFFTFINFFNVISFQFMEKFDCWERIVLSLSFLLISLHLILIVVSITLTCEDALYSLRSLVIPLRSRLGK